MFVAPQKVMFRPLNYFPTGFSQNLFVNGKQPLFPFVPRISSRTNQKNVYHLHPNRNFWEFVVNGKQAQVPVRNRSSDCLFFDWMSLKLPSSPYCVGSMVCFGFFCFEKYLRHVRLHQMFQFVKS